MILDYSNKHLFDLSDKIIFRHTNLKVLKGSIHVARNINRTFVQRDISTVSDDSKSHVMCWCRSTMCSKFSNQKIRLHFMLPSSDKLYEDADFMLQQDMEMQY